MSTSTPGPRNAVGRGAYTSGAYLEKNPLWHTDESPFKVKQILKMIRKERCAAGDHL